ncbi:MAG: HD domain-containing protein [Bradymonadales bacterium]|nr:HD domain-containing protein [Bradymonadales bacterium]
MNQKTKDDRESRAAQPGRTAVSDLRPGERVTTTLLTLDKQALVTRTGAPYLSLLLGDRSGQVNAKVWEKAELYEQSVDSGDIIRVDAHVETYKGQVQLRVVHLERAALDGIDIGEFLPASRFDRGQMMSELRQLVARELNDPDVRRVLLAVLGNQEVAQGLLRAPAAKLNHHAYIGGLLEHTLSMCRLAQQIARHYARQYPNLLDTDLLVAGAVLHDIGKIWELSSEPHIDLTDAGRLLGHIPLAVALLDRVLKSLDLEDTALALRLKHMILSHHGEYEYGAVVLPQTPEAQVLHYLDQVDAKLNMFADAIERTEGSWSAYVKPLGHFVYAGNRPQGDAGNPAEDGAGGEDSRSTSGKTLDLFAPPKTTAEG